jgi:hypothetical protein
MRAIVGWVVIVIRLHRRAFAATTFALASPFLAYLAAVSDYVIGIIIPVDTH